MKDFWKKHKIKIVILFYIAATLSLVRFAVVPFVEKIKERSDDVQERIINNKINETRVEEIPDMERTLEDYKKNSQALDVILGTEDEVDFIKQMELIADITGNKIILSVGDNNVEKNSDRTSSDEEKPIKDNLKYKNYISMDINLKGSYSGLVNFVNKLENTSYYVNVISIRSKKAKESTTFKSNDQTSSYVFSAVPSQDVTPQSEPVRDEKDLLESFIKVVIYIKK